MNIKEARIEADRLRAEALALEFTATEKHTRANLLLTWADAMVSAQSLDIPELLTKAVVDERANAVTPAEVLTP